VGCVYICVCARARVCVCLSNVCQCSFNNMYPSMPVISIKFHICCIHLHQTLSFNNLLSVYRFVIHLVMLLYTVCMMVVHYKTNRVFASAAPGCGFDLNSLETFALQPTARLYGCRKTILAYERITENLCTCYYRARKRTM
jgi:hypothetical protein